MVATSSAEYYDTVSKSPLLFYVRNKRRMSASRSPVYSKRKRRSREWGAKRNPPRSSGNNLGHVYPYPTIGPRNTRNSNVSSSRNDVVSRLPQPQDPADAGITRFNVTSYDRRPARCVTNRQCHMNALCHFKLTGVIGEVMLASKVDASELSVRSRNLSANRRKEIHMSAGRIRHLRRQLPREHLLRTDE